MFLHRRLNGVDRDGANNENRHLEKVKSLQGLHRQKVRSREHVSRAARVINNAVRLEQRGYHYNALCPGVDHTL